MVDPLGAAVPAEQALHDVPSFAYVPAGQGVHAAAEEPEMEPAAQVVHLVDPLGAAVPAEQALHDVPSFA